MRDFQALKFLIGIFEVRDVDARIRIACTHSCDAGERDGRTNEGNMSTDVKCMTVRVQVRAYASNGTAHRVSESAPFEFRWLTTSDNGQSAEGTLASTARCELRPVEGACAFTRYACDLTPSVFETLRKAQSLTLRNARECAETCARALARATAEPDRCLAVLVCSHDGSARLEIVEDGGHRLVTVLELPFYHVGEDEIRASVANEYGEMKRRLAAYVAKFGEIEC